MEIMGVLLCIWMPVESSSLCRLLLRVLQDTNWNPLSRVKTSAPPAAWDYWNTGEEDNPVLPWRVSAHALAPQALYNALYRCSGALYWTPKMGSFILLLSFLCYWPPCETLSFPSNSFNLGGHNCRSWSHWGWSLWEAGHNALTLGWRSL